MAERPIQRQKQGEQPVFRVNKARVFNKVGPNKKIPTRGQCDCGECGACSE